MNGILDKKAKVSLVVIRRLPRYYRYLSDLIAQGIRRISSRELSDKMNVTASQIRQDLNCFGGFGQQGYGYNIEFLHKEIAQILGIDIGYKTIIIGAGNLGRALANHVGFERRGFKMVALFDNDAEKIGMFMGGVPVYDIADVEGFISDNGIDIAVLAIPKGDIQYIAKKLIDCGIKGLWNYSYIDLEIEKDIDVAVENVHLSDSLMTLGYKIQERETNKVEDEKQND